MLTSQRVLPFTTMATSSELSHAPSASLEIGREALSAREQNEVDAAGERDRRAWADDEAKRVAREVAEDVYHLLVYAIAEGDVDALEALRARLKLASFDDALVVSRLRAAAR